MSEHASVRPDGPCQRCGHACLSFCVDSHGGGWERWAGAYIGGAPPDPGRMTCLLCLDPEELARVTAKNPDGVVANLLTRLREHGMFAG